MFFSRKSHSRRIERLEEAIPLLTKHIAQLQDDLADLEDKHIRLRGRVYATGMHKQDDDSPEPTAPARKRLSRDELRKLSGFRPGTPMEHNE